MVFERSEGESSEGEAGIEGPPIVFCAPCSSQIDAHFEEAIRVDYPSPATPGGPAQRIRLQVDSPRSIFTVGARGTATSEGEAIGPGGFGLYTRENLGFHVAGSALATVVGNTVWTTHGGTRSVTLGELGVVAGQSVLMGTNEGDIEITAGDVAVVDPRFTVSPSMPPPAVPVVDPAAPRATVESLQDAWSATWSAVDFVSAVRTLCSMLDGNTAGVSGARLHRLAAATLAGARAAGTVADGLFDTLVTIGTAAGDPHADKYVRTGPGLRLHSVGGVNMTTDGKAAIFGTQGVSIASPASVGLKGGVSASLVSVGAAKVYGAVSATLQSAAVVAIKGTVVGIGARFAEVAAKQVAAVKSEGDLLLEAKRKATLGGHDVAVCGEAVGIAAEADLRLDATGQAYLAGERGVEIKSAAVASIEAAEALNATGDSVLITGERSRVRVDRAGVELFGPRLRFRALELDSASLVFRGRSVRLC